MKFNFNRIGKSIALLAMACFIALTQLIPGAQAQAIDSIHGVLGPQTLNSPNGPACGTASLNGTVTAADTGLPVANLLVQFNSADAISIGASGVSDANGHYSFILDTPSSVTPRQVTLSVSTSSTPYQDYAPSTIIQVAAGTTTTHDVVLQRGGSITGVVTAADSSLPLTPVTVSAYYKNAVGISIGREATTDASGHYTIAGLSANAYILVFKPTAAAVDYLVTYFGGGFTEAGATKVTVTVPLTSQADIALALGIQISGTVTNGNTSTPLSFATVLLFSETNDPINSHFTGSLSDGTYALRGLNPGHYKLAFAPPIGSGLLPRFYGGSTTFAAASVIIATSNSVANITLPLGGSISGTLRDAVTNAPVPNVTVSASNTNPTPTDLEKIGLSGGSYAYGDAAGAYTLTGLESGVYNLSLAPDFSSIYLGQTVPAVTVTAPAVTPNVNATFVKGGRISGKIVDPQGAPILGVGVTVQKVGGTTLFYASTNASGVYTTSGALAPGSYTVHFTRGVSACQACYDDQYYNSTPGQTTPSPVAVLTGQVTLNINATLACNPAPAIFFKNYQPLVIR